MPGLNEEVHRRAPETRENWTVVNAIYSCQASFWRTTVHSGK